MNIFPHERMNDRSGQGGPALRRGLASLSDSELHRLLTIVTLLLGADEALADVRIGLATVEIGFYALDDSPPRKVSFLPSELLPQVQSAMHRRQSAHGVRLLLDC